MAIQPATMSSTCFVIQASNPRATGARDPLDEKVADAVQSVFALHAEAAFLDWNHVLVKISYKYDFGIILDDVMDMLEAVMNAESGEFRTAWPSNTFFAEWTVTWDTMVEIQSHWHEVVGGPVSALNAAPIVVVPKADFVREWKRPLEIVRAAVVSAGYDSSSLSDLDRLTALLARMLRSGVLYEGE